MTLLVVGGTRGIGREIAKKYADAGDSVVITGRHLGHAEEVAKEIGGDIRGIDLELSRPEAIAEALRDVDGVDGLVIAAIERDANTAKDYDLAAAQHLVTMKLVGYTEVIHTLLPRMSDEAAIVLFGGLAKERPYPGSTTVSTVNGGVSGLVHTLATELAPMRVNAIHPGIVGDSPFWSDKAAATEAVKARTPLGRNVAMDDIVDAVDFLLRNRSVNGIDLNVDGGWLLL
ncbi:MAG TPA: SDR family oxidoreductase [Nocardioidaceae bacterium]|nr:SDR family oxidoreductase [Nocardioidaceae bacterium]